MQGSAQMLSRMAHTSFTTLRSHTIIKVFHEIMHLAALNNLPTRKTKDACVFLIMSKHLLARRYMTLNGFIDAVFYL